MMYESNGNLDSFPESRLVLGFFIYQEGFMYNFKSVQILYQTWAMV